MTRLFSIVAFSGLIAMVMSACVNKDGGADCAPEYDVCIEEACGGIDH